MMKNIQGLYISNLDSCCPRIIYGFQIEHLLSWIFNEFVHPVLRFSDFLWDFRISRFEKVWRPSTAFQFWWDNHHPSSCSGSAWKAWRQRVFPLSADWHLDIDTRDSLLPPDWISWLKIKQNKCVSPFLRGLKGRPASH